MVNPDASAQVIADPQLQALSAREREILALIGQGLTQVEIAACLNRSPETVKSHRAEIARKLGFGDRVHLARFAIQYGLATVPLSEDGEQLSLIESSIQAWSIPAFCCDADSRVVAANAAVHKLLTTDAEPLVGRCLSDHRVLGECPGLDSMCAAALASGAPRTLVAQLPWPVRHGQTHCISVVPMQPVTQPGRHYLWITVCAIVNTIRPSVGSGHVHPV